MSSLPVCELITRVHNNTFINFISLEPDCFSTVSSKTAFIVLPARLKLVVAWKVWPIRLGMALEGTKLRALVIEYSQKVITF